MKPAPAIIAITTPPLEEKKLSTVDIGRGIKADNWSNERTSQYASVFKEVADKYQEKLKTSEGSRFGVADLHAAITRAKEAKTAGEVPLSFTT